MVMASEMIIEKVDNGIVIRWNDVEGKFDPVSRVAVDGDEPKNIGSEIWRDVLEILTTTPNKKVLVSLKYQAI